VRCTVALFDAASGRCLWAGAWEGEREDALGFEERVAHGLVAKLQTMLRNAEIERACRKEPEQSTAWELTMRSLSRAVLLEPGAQTEALELAEQAIELAPLDPLPLAVAAWCHGMRAGHHFTARPTAERAAALALAGRSSQLSGRDPTAEALLASAYTLAHDMEQAELHIDRALALDGGCAWAWQRSGWVKVYAGEGAEAIERFQIARSLDPTDRLGFLTSIGIAAANFERAAYADAIRWFKRGIAESSTAVWANRFLAPAYALSGRKEDAQTSLAALMRVYPDWTIAQVRSALPHTAGFVDRAANGLESIGMRLY
jgi:tetratricopeptide (TPR) repeat protein